MKKSRFSESQIISILKQAQSATPVPELCREHGMSSAAFYKWRSKYGGMDASMITRMKELEEENRRLKKMYAEERLKAEIIAEAMQKKWWRHLNDGRWRKAQCKTRTSAFAWHAKHSVSARPVIATRPSCHPRTKKLPTGWYG
jgi:putative transposase